MKATLSLTESTTAHGCTHKMSLHALPEYWECGVAGLRHGRRPTVVRGGTVGGFHMADAGLQGNGGAVREVGRIRGAPVVVFHAGPLC